MPPPVLILTPHRLMQLALAVDRPVSLDPARAPQPPAETGGILELPAIFRDRPRPVPCTFQAAGDAVLLVGVPAPGLQPEALAAAFDHTMAELAERAFLASAASTSLASLGADVLAACGTGFGLRWCHGAMAECHEVFASNAPLALVSCLSRAHLALSGCVERTHAIATVMLGHVTCTGQPAETSP